MTQHHVPEDLPTHLQHFIGGQWVDSIGGETFDVLDPVSNQNYATCAAGQKADIDRAVAAAKQAFDSGPWPRLKPRDRFRILNRIADLVEERDARLAELETFDTGLPIKRIHAQASIVRDAWQAAVCRGVARFGECIFNECFERFLCFANAKVCLTHKFNTQRRK